MIESATNRQFSLTKGFLAIFMIFCLSFSIAGSLGEVDCHDECQGEPGVCCECICCPNKVILTTFDDMNLNSESGSFLWNVPGMSLSSEQEWFVPIDHPPQNFS